MFRFLFLTTALAGVASVAVAQDAYANGSYSHAGGSVAHGAQPTLGSVYDSAAPVYQTAPTYDTLGGQYQVAPATTQTYGVDVHSGTVQADTAYAPAQSTTQTYSIAPGNSQTYTVPAGQDATYNIVVPTAAPAPVYAQPEAIYAPQPVAAATGWAARGVYFGARGGVTSNDDTKFTIAGLKKKPSNTVRSEYDTGYTGSVVVGYGARQPHGWGYRMELEAGYQTASVDTHTISGIGKFGGNEAKGDAKTLYGFVNAYGDIPITDRLALTAGGGVGIGTVKFEDYGVAGAGKALDDSATTFGYHLDAGVSYQVSEQVALEALYRYQTFVDAEVRTENGNDTKIDLTSHSVLAGVRVGF